MAQFTFADEDDAQPAPQPPPSQAPPLAVPEPAPSQAPAATQPKPASFSFTLDDEPEPPSPQPTAPTTPASTPAVSATPVAASTSTPGVSAPNAPPAVPRPPVASGAPGGAVARPSAPPAAPVAGPAPPAAPLSAVAAPTAPRPPQAPATPPGAPRPPAAPQVLAGPPSPARPPAAASDNPVRDAAQRAAQAPDRGASAGMVGGAIPNVAGPRAPSPPQPNQVSNPPGTPQAPVAPAAPVGPGAPQAAPTTARQAAAAQANAERAARQAAQVTKATGAPPAPVAPTVHAVTPGMAAATITPDVVLDHSRDWRHELSKLDPILNWLFRMAGILAVLSLAYVLFGLFAGAGNPEAFTNPATREKALQFTHDLHLATQILHWSLLVTAVTTLILVVDVGFVGPVIAAVGFLLHFGVPLLMVRMGMTPATANVAVTLRVTGMILLVLGLGKYSIDFFRWLQGVPDRVKARADIGSSHKAEAKQQAIARNANMFSPCWQLPFCREVIRKQCPAFLARKKCWKFGRGCYCDEEMISRIIRGESLERIKAPTAMSAKKPPCGRCHIFIEHQSLKYKVMAPLAVPATVGIMYSGWGLFSEAFLGLSHRMDALWTLMSFDKSRITPEAFKVDNSISTATSAASDLSAEHTAQYGLWIFGILIGFFMLIYISKLIEWLVLEKKL